MHFASEAPEKSVELLSASSAKSAVETYLHDYFKRRTNDATTLSPDYVTLWNAIERVTLAGGKRLRPYLVLLSYEAFGGCDYRDIIPAASAVELLHAAMLIHDDIIDRDDVRHGVKNIAGTYREIYAALGVDSSESKHYAMSAAILAGDALLSDAYSVLAETKLDSMKILGTLKLMNEAIFKVIGGELLDTEGAIRPKEVVDTAAIIDAKTASYSFITPLLIGAHLAGNSSSDKLLRALGRHVGTAFQLRDDILGVWGDSNVTGKTTDGDIHEGKYTHLIETFMKHAGESDKAKFMELFGDSSLDQAGLTTARDLLTRSGARAQIESEIKASIDTSLSLVRNLDIDDAHKQRLGDLIILSADREH